MKTDFVNLYYVGAYLLVFTDLHELIQPYQQT